MADIEPGPDNDYQVSPTLTFDRALWNAVMASIAARLKARELLEASFNALIGQGTQAALDLISQNVAPQLESLVEQIHALEEQLEDIIGGGTAPNALMLGGQLPAFYQALVNATGTLPIEQVAGLVAALGSKFDKNGGAVSGDVAIEKGWPTLTLNKAASGQGNVLGGQLAGKQRWQIRLGSDHPETGDGGGSNLDVTRFGDAGNYLDIPFSLDRKTGRMGLSQRPFFGIDTPWDTSNFNPDLKADKTGGIFTGTVGARNSNIHGYVVLHGDTTDRAGYIGWYGPDGIRWGFMGYGNAGLTALMLVLESGKNLEIAGGTVIFDRRPSWGGATPWDSSNASASINTSGYQKLPSGLILQWGFNGSGVQDPTFSLPITFPTANLMAVANIAVAGFSVTDAFAAIVYARGLSTLGVAQRYIGGGGVSANPYPFTWFAIGY